MKKTILDTTPEEKEKISQQHISDINVLYFFYFAIRGEKFEPTNIAVCVQCHKEIRRAVNGRETNDFSNGICKTCAAGARIITKTGYYIPALR